MKSGKVALLLACFALSTALAHGQSFSKPSVEQATLTEPGGTPFHLQAVITERADPNEHIDIEMSWVAPDKWRRIIRSEEFSQTLIVNGDKVFEQDSDDYFPLGIQVLATAMVDPKPVLDAVRPGDRVLTKANGASDESGRTCFDAARKMCGVGGHGLMESLGAPGHSVDFMEYQKFKSKRVARLLVWHVDPGDSLQARVTTLGEFKSDETLFLISKPTPREKQTRSVIVPDAELRDLALQPTEIVWPQVLEGDRTTGETSYYVSLDRSGQVREIFPLSVAIERADDSARRQIMKWKFKPVVRDGVPVQAEAVLNFHFDTRAYGPRSPLTDAEARKLATNTIDPEFPAGTPAGALCNIRIAVDADGRVIEQIAGEGSPELTTPCMKAIGEWRFRPIFENGQPRPYRAEVTFRSP